MQDHRATAVTMIGSLPPHRGVSPYTLDLAAALAARDDVDLDVVAFRSLYPTWLYPGGDPEDGSGDLVSVPSAATRRPLRWWNPFGWLLAGMTLRGDIVHAQWWSYPLAPVYVVLLACARLRRKTVIVTIHNVEPHEGGLLRRVANRAVVPFAHRIIVHTAENARTLRAARGETRPVDVIPIGVRRASSPPRRDAARQRIGVAPGAPVALFFGNIRPYKGVLTLVQAFRRVRDVMPAARLVLAGEPWSGGADAIRAEIIRLGLEDAVLAHLSYLPADEIPHYFAAADVVVYPYTHFDAQSAAACTALAYGKAIVVTSAGGLPELAGDDRAIVPPGDAERLASALLHVLTEGALRGELEAHSRDVATRMSWPAVAAATAEVYELAARRGSSAHAGEAQLTVDTAK